MCSAMTTVSLRPREVIVAADAGLELRWVMYEPASAGDFPIEPILARFIRSFLRAAAGLWSIDLAPKTVPVLLIREFEALFLGPVGILEAEISALTRASRAFQYAFSSKSGAEAFR